MNITITGATGFIGRRLIERLSTAPHQLHALTRYDPRHWHASGDNCTRLARRVAQEE